MCAVAESSGGGALDHGQDSSFVFSGIRHVQRDGSEMVAAQSKSDQLGDGLLAIQTAICPNFWENCRKKRFRGFLRKCDPQCHRD
jgi:hypothetical protein